MRYLHTMVRVADLDKALGFYCEALGLEEAYRIENAPPRTRPPRKPIARPWSS
jgi:lactoylglutathione lyase